MEIENPGNELDLTETLPQSMDVETSSVQIGLQAKCGENHVDLGVRLHEMIAEDSLDFGSWTFLISEIEKVHADNINMLSLVYDSFLSKFLLCHWYWTKYAYHKARLCTVVEAVDIFERAVESTTFSVGFWLSYCTFSESFFEDPSDIRRVYERALSFVGKDYNCHVLWDKYLQFEFSQQQWGMLAHIYIRALKFPTKGLCFYYDNFQNFVTVMEEEIKGEDDDNILVDPDDIPIIELMKSKDEIPRIIKDLQDLSDASRRSRALHKYKTIGNQFYQKALELDKEIKSYEAKIQTNYFQERLIDDDEISNWHQYLDFIEKQEDFDWGLKLYERCLISCAKYPEFWMRYIEFMETRRGRPLAIFALDRATKVFLKDVPQIHSFSARFKEQIGDIKGARDAYHLLMGSDEFIEYVVRQANMEKRVGNLSAASEIYEEALKTAVEQQKMHLLPSLYTHFYRLKYMVTGSVDAAIDVIINGIQRVPYCRVLLEELINFAMSHDGTKCINVIDSIVSKAISPSADAPDGFDMKDKLDISCLYMELVDLCGTLDDIKKASSRHNKLFPQVLRPDSLSKLPPLRSKSSLNEMKKRRKISPCTMHEHSVQVHQPLPLIDHSTKINQVSEDLSLQQGDGNNSLEKRTDSSPEVAPQTSAPDIELDGLYQYQGPNKHTDDSSEAMNLAPEVGGLDTEATSASMETDPVVIQQHRENSPIPTEATDDCVPSETFSESFQHVSCSVDNNPDLGNEPEHGSKMGSLENLSLDSEEKKPVELINESLIDEIPAAKGTLEEQVPADPPSIKQSSTSDCPKTSHPHSADWQHGSYVSKPDDPPSPGHLENHILEQDHPNSSRSPSPGGNSHFVSQSVDRDSGTTVNHADSHAQQQQPETTTSQQPYVSALMGQELPMDGGSSNRLLGNSRLVSQSVERDSGTSVNHADSHAQQKQPETTTSQQPYESALMGRELPMDGGSSDRFLASIEGSHGEGRYHPGVAEGNAENNHAWTVNNVSQQRGASEGQSQLSTLLGKHPQSNMSCPATDSGQQTETPQSQEATNQISQYQYHQRQQVMQHYEQQMLQIQQQYVQHQQQQNQLQLQQGQSQALTTLLQQQQFVQQQQLQSLPYQLQQLHQQQISYWQQVQQQPSQISAQQYLQANGLGQQFNQSGYQQQADQGYQLLLQQYQLQQQGYYYTMQQQQQQQLQQQQQQQQQRQQQQEGSNN